MLSQCGLKRGKDKAISLKRTTIFDRYRYSHAVFATDEVRSASANFTIACRGRNGNLGGRSVVFA